MSLKNSPDLPKSVKVRSTCNACRQAKIRCSHEKPSCRRCQKHNIDCIYSVSRRLGRPAKKRETEEPRNKEYRVEKRAQTARRKVNEHESQKNEARRSEESTEDGLQSPPLGEGAFLDNVDFAPDSWLQDFVSGPSSDGEGLNLLESPDTSISTGFKDPTIVLPTSSASETPDQNASGHFQDTTFPTNVPVDYLTTPPATAPKPAYPEYPKGNWLFDSLTDSLLPPTDQSCFFRGDEFSPSIPLDSPSLGPLMQCQCYEQAIRELIRVNNFASRTAHSSVDTILTCQRGLQQLAETVLQCGTCSTTRVNLLTVIIVSIDGLLSTVEATTSAAKAGAFDPLSDEEMGTGVDFHIGRGRRYNVTSPATTGFKSQIETCPLVVGSFRIPSDEKYCFIKQLLHRRLSALLATIRRIRFCTQQILATSCSRGRQIMVMETDRRLQLIMMKVKMLSK